MTEMAEELGAHRAKEFNVGINPAKLGALCILPFAARNNMAV